jgi:hypothetical protein
MLERRVRKLGIQTNKGTRILRKRRDYSILTEASARKKTNPNLINPNVLQDGFPPPFPPTMRPHPVGPCGRVKDLKLQRRQD